MANLDVFQEAGEAIGNVTRRWSRRRKRFDVQQALERWEARVPLPHIQPTKKEGSQPDDEVIDVTCRIGDDEDMESEHE
jgi:hypothetical protein